MTAPAIDMDAKASPIKWLIPDCYNELRIDFQRDGYAFLYSRHESEHFQPMAAWRGHLQIYRLHSIVDPKCFYNYYNSSIRPRVQIALNGYSNEWDSHTNSIVARYSDSAQRALDEIEELFAASHDFQYWGLYDDTSGIWDAYAWFADDQNAGFLTPDTTDAQIDAQIPEIESSAAEQNAVLTGLRTFLIERRDALADKQQTVYQVIASGGWPPTKMGGKETK